MRFPGAFLSAASTSDPARAFRARVERIVKAIPKGQVLSYGRVALLAGKHRGARDGDPPSTQAARRRPRDPRPASLGSAAAPVTSSEARVVLLRGAFVH